MAILQETTRIYLLQLTEKIIMDMPPAALAQGLDSEKIVIMMGLLFCLRKGKNTCFKVETIDLAGGTKANRTPLK